jgi:hypothetical protein
MNNNVPPPRPAPPPHQAGELRTPQRMAYLEDVVRGVRAATVAQDLEARGLDPQVCAVAAAPLWVRGGAGMWQTGCRVRVTGEG